MEVALWLYIWLLLLPITGLYFMAARRERIRNQQILMAYWRMKHRRRRGINY